jgi:hypothetical protein
MINVGSPHISAPMDHPLIPQAIRQVATILLVAEFSTVVIELLGFGPLATLIQRLSSDIEMLVLAVLLLLTFLLLWLVRTLLISPKFSLLGYRSSWFLTLAGIVYIAILYWGAPPGLDLYSLLEGPVAPVLAQSYIGALLFHLRSYYLRPPQPPAPLPGGARRHTAIVLSLVIARPMSILIILVMRNNNLIY